ncbi:MAG: peptidase M14 [Anaerolineae bacterium]|nr:peptidase M14 [Anaerolineae bacterium]
MIYTIDFTEYFFYDNMTHHLHRLANAYPALAALSSIGKSHRGRDVWLMTITNRDTGPDSDKPAFYIDANIHAEEVSTTSVALYTIWYLLTQYGQNAEVTWLLDNLTFYIIPRFNPDGAEISLTTPHHWCGNGRYLPGEEQTHGLCQHDINGDGLIVEMRIEDPAGEWTVSKADPRLMILRKPGEVGDGPYYRMYREGEIRGAWDGTSFEIEKPRDGNMNRNFPAGWRPEFRQYGAGDYPLSEPEALAVAQFILSHKNIAGIQNYHTHGGVHLRPSLVAPDSAIPRNDLAVYKTIGAMGTALTGYPVISVYEEFTSDPDQPRVGSLMQWTYDELGIVTFSTELWNPERAAGFAEPAKYQLRARSEEDEVALLRYNDTHLGGKGFVNWTPFDHPQLGRVEIGGWTHMYTFRNPPPASFATTDEAKAWLPDMCHQNCLFTLKHAACSPLIRITDVQSESLSANLHKITATVSNQGYLPTYLTEMSLKHNTSGEVVAGIIGDGVEVIMGLPEQRLGHLAGRDERTATWSPWMRDWHATTKRVEWLIRAPSGACVTVTACAQRGGTHRRQLTI